MSFAEIVSEYKSGGRGPCYTLIYCQACGWSCEAGPRVLPEDIGTDPRVLKHRLDHIEGKA